MDQIIRQQNNAQSFHSNYEFCAAMLTDLKDKQYVYIPETVIRKATFEKVTAIYVNIYYVICQTTITVHVITGQCVS